MNVAIVGAGALGSLYGGYLHANGENVSLYTRREDHVRAINERGLTIRNRIGGNDVTVAPDAYTSTDTIGRRDAVFIFTKAHHTRQAILDAKPLIDAETAVVTLQNGLRNVDIIQEQPFVPTENVLGGYAYTGATMETPGEVIYTAAGRDKIGGDTELARAVATMISDAGIDIDVVDEPRAHIWDKQLSSVAFKPMAALTGLRIGELSEIPLAWDIMVELVTEAIQVADAEGIRLSPESAAELLRERTELSSEAKSSMLQDVEQRRSTEIDHINGAVLEFAESHGIRTPYNRMATALVKAKESSYLE